MVVFSLTLDNHVCAYDADTYIVLTLQMKNPIHWIYPCYISMVCIVVSLLYYSTKTNLGGQYRSKVNPFS